MAHVPFEKQEVRYPSEPSERRREIELVHHVSAPRPVRVEKVIVVEACKGAAHLRVTEVLWPGKRSDA